MISIKIRKCDYCERDSTNYKIRKHKESGKVLCNKHYQQYTKYGEVLENKPRSGNIKDLTGQKFGKLTVLKIDEEKKSRKTYWICKCQCGNKKSIRSDNLISKITISCGECSYNTYEFYEDYVKIFGSNGLPFYIDLNDYERVSKHTWRVNKKSKRVYATINKKTIFLHNFILNVKAEAIDHIDGNPSNNRKYNLRICTIQKNSCNQKLHTNNTSGVTGVWWNKKTNKWVAELKYKQEKVLCKQCDSFIDAIINRIKAEVKFFGEYRSFRNDNYINTILNEYGYSLEDILKSIEVI